MHAQSFSIDEIGDDRIESASRTHSVTFGQARFAPTFFRCAFFCRRGSRALALGSNLPFFSDLGVLGFSGAAPAKAAILPAVAPIAFAAVTNAVSSVELVSTAFSFFAKVISS